MMPVEDTRFAPVSPHPDSLAGKSTYVGQTTILASDMSYNGPNPILTASVSHPTTHHA